MKATDVKSPADWIEYQHQEIGRHVDREKELLGQIKKLLEKIVKLEQRLENSNRSSYPYDN